MAKPCKCKLSVQCRSHNSYIEAFCDVLLSPISFIKGGDFRWILYNLSSTLYHGLVVHHRVSSWQYFLGFCLKSLSADSWYSNGYKLRSSSRRHLSVFIRSGIHTVFALNEQETVCILCQFYLQVHQWSIVDKQPRIRKLTVPDVSCWTWDQGQHSPISYLDLLLSIGRDGQLHTSI